MPTVHPTYHHFTGSGASDSDLDVLLYGGNGKAYEAVSDIICELQQPLMASHHDLIVSTCSVPHYHPEHVNESENITAPRVPNLRFSTKWSEEGVIEYKQALSPLLSDIRKTWGNTQDKSAVAIILSSTYAAINLAAKVTNKVIWWIRSLKLSPKATQV